MQMNDRALVESPSDIAGESVKYLTFTVLKEPMAVGILDVKEIIEVGRLTRVPMARHGIRGVINLRGNVVPVIDLRSRLVGTDAKLSKRSCIVLVQVGIAEQVIGMLVDGVNEILDISNADIHKAPDFGTDIDHEFIDKIARFNDEFIILLNLDRVLSISDMPEVGAETGVTVT
jgi:purine-binding chemotaxis protein CheW